MISCWFRPQFGNRVKGAGLVVWSRSVRIIAKFYIRFDCPHSLTNFPRVGGRWTSLSGSQRMRRLEKLLGRQTRPISGTRSGDL